MNKDCKHRIKYRCEINYYQEEYNKEAKYQLSKESECNGSNCDLNNYHRLFIKNKNVTHFLTFDKIIECAYLYLEKNQYTLPQNINWENAPSQKFNQIYELQGIKCEDKNKLTMMISANEKNNIFNKGYEKAKKDLLENLFRKEVD